MNRIKLYSLALAIIYFLIVGHELISSVSTFKAGLEAGWEQGKEESMSPLEYLHLSVEPREGLYAYPDTVLNLLTGTSVRMEIDKVKLRVSFDSAERPMSLKVYKFFRVLFSFAALFLVLTIPILFFKIIRAVTQDRIIDERMISRLLKLGWILIAYNLLGILFYLGEVLLMAPNMVQLEKYIVRLDFMEYTMLIVGIITLLISEILKVSLRMKEEQELTI